MSTRRPSGALEDGGVDFFAVAGAKQVLKSFNKSTLTQLWCHCARANQAAAPSARRDLIAGLRKVVEQAGNRHLTELPSLDVLRSVAVGLKVPLTRNNPSKVECAKRITEHLQDNGLDYMLDRLDDAQLAALCEALGMVLAVGEGEQPLDRHRRSLSIRAAINSAGLHSFMASLDVALVEQMAKDVGMPLTEDHPGDKMSKKRNKKGALITYILTTAHQGGHQAGPGSSTAAAADEVAKENTEENTEEKGKEKVEKIEEKGKEKADVEDDELDLDNLAQYPLAKLKAYCVEEQLTVAKPATKKSYIAAITAHNDRLAREEEEAELHKQKRKENKMKEKELITATTSPAVASAPPSSSSSSSSGAAAAVTSPTPKRYKMLTLVKSETPGAKTAVASPAPVRQETTTPQTPTKAPVAEVVATPKSKGRKRAREEEQGEQAPRKEAPLAPASSSSGTSNDDAVCEVLSGIGLAKYAAKFAAEEIDMAALLLLDEGHLVALGMPLGSRIKLLQQISILKEEERQRQGSSSSSKKPRKAEEKSDEENENENENEDKNEENEDEKEEAEAEAPKPVRRAKRRRSEFEQLAEQQKKWERRLEAREKRRSFTPNPLADLVLQEGGGEGEKEEEKEGDALQPNQEPVGVAGLANDTAGVIDLVGA